jgi:hypothetical protein
MEEGRKVFFFEKKKQKTFISWRLRCFDLFGGHSTLPRRKSFLVPGGRASAVFKKEHS